MRLVPFLFAVLVVGGATRPVRAQTASATESRPQLPVIGPQPAPLRRPVTLTMRDAPLLTVIQEIDRQADLGLGYTDRLLAGRRVTVALSDVPAQEALTRVLAGTGIVVQLSARGGITLVRRDEPTGTAEVNVVAPQAVGALLGLLTDSVTGKPVPDVPVTVYGVWPEAINGVSRSIKSNEQGYYYFPELEAGRYYVVARRVGYRPARRDVQIAEGQQTRADIEFGLGLTQLTRIVTTATGTQRRIERGNDITTLDADSITSTQLVRSVSDLIATRVPGLVALPTSGAPGDPMRLRLRGLHSVLQSDDPIVVVDGMRVYSDQSSPRAQNLAAGGNSWIGTSPHPPAPSPLDQIDPNSIESVEVLKGPSAAALYGSDAANGVIVIRTKRGHAGPARWTSSAELGRTDQPGSYPTGYIRWGRPTAYDGPLMWCPLRSTSCTLDSVTQYQLLNDPRRSPLGTGDRYAASVGVSGGSAELTYNVVGSLADELGLLRLPGPEADAFAQREGFTAPDWMRRPHHFRRASVTTSLGATPSQKLTVGLTTSLTREQQRRSSLETQLGGLMRLYVDSTTGTTWVADGGSVYQTSDYTTLFFRRLTDDATTFRNGLNATWRPLGWLTATADAGLDFTDREDRLYNPRGLKTGFGDDTLGVARVGQGTTLVRSLTVQATASSRAFAGFRLETALGVNYAATTLTEITAGGKGLADGSSSLTGLAFLDPPTETGGAVSTLGWFIEPRISHKRIWITPGIRFDGGSTVGSRAKLAAYPQLGVSYLISDERFFPLKNQVSQLRLRLAYGQAGVQPGLGDRLRLYTKTPIWVDSQLVNGTVVRTLGNTEIRPERSTEWEGGFDADMLDERLHVAYSAYHTTRRDALMSVPVPPSVYGSLITGVLRNVGVIRNTGLNASVSGELVRSGPVTFGVDASVARNRNLVVSLARGVTPFFNSTGDGRVVAGYPLYGRWAKPVIGFRDLNGDGIITANEVQVGDTLVFMGESLPNYTAQFGPHASFLRGRVRVDAGFSYENGLTQINEAARLDRAFSRAYNDPAAPLAEQAAVAVMDRTDYGLMQTVSTLRFNALSVAYAASPRFAALMRAQAVTVLLQGSNLGLHTNYRGIDPDVNAYSSGSSVVDSGVLPLPRTWQLRISANY